MRLPYTKNDLERIVDKHDPIPAPAISNISLPKRLEYAAVNIFIDDTATTKDAMQLRTALIDLRKDGQFNYSNA
jgi:hypothetical protein